MVNDGSRNGDDVCDRKKERYSKTQGTKKESKERMMTTTCNILHVSNDIDILSPLFLVVMRAFLILNGCNEQPSVRTSHDLSRSYTLFVLVLLQICKAAVNHTQLK